MAFGKLFGERAPKQERNDTEEKQEQIGEELFDALTQAAERNTQVAETNRKLHIGKIEQNGGAYSVTFHLEDEAGTHAMGQFDVRMKREGEELHALYGPYGPDEYFGVDQLSEFIEKAVERVETFN